MHHIFPARANYPRCEIVLVSGHPGAAELVDISNKQGQSLSVLPKPLDPKLILAIAARQVPVPQKAAEADA